MKDALLGHSTDLMCGLIASLRFVHEVRLTGKLRPGENGSTIQAAFELEDRIRRILDRQVLVDDRLSDPYSTYAVMAVRDRFFHLGYTEAIAVVRKRRLPVIQEWWPHGSRRIVPKPSGEAG